MTRTVIGKINIIDKVEDFIQLNYFRFLKNLEAYLFPGSVIHSNPPIIAKQITANM